jgi:hypothetical protein
MMAVPMRKNTQPAVWIVAARGHRVGGDEQGDPPRAVRVAGDVVHRADQRRDREDRHRPAAPDQQGQAGRGQQQVAELGRVGQLCQLVDWGDPAGAHNLEERDE